MNKGVTIAGGVILLLSVILTVAGGAITANSGENLENIDDSPQPFYTASEGGSTTFAFIDEDLAGSLAFQVLLDLDYVDEDNDGIVDNCNGFVVKVTDEDGVDVTENVSRVSCVYDEWTAEDQIHNGKVVHSDICGTIPELSGSDKCDLRAEYTVEVMLRDSNESQDFVLFDQDAYTINLMEKALGDLGGLLGGGSLAFVALCCGLPIGLIILIIGLAIGGNPPQPVMMQQAYVPVPNVGGSPVIGQMQAPVSQMQAPISQMAPPISTPVQESPTSEFQN